jgi:hypothetical protein
MSKIIEASTRGAKRANLVRALQDHLPFATSGALRGNAYNNGNTGRLVGADLDRYHADANKIIYVVISYNTPIAWVTQDGTVYNVGMSFSATTSKHQGTVRAYLK